MSLGSLAQLEGGISREQIFLEIDAFCDAIKKRKLNLPLILFLEMHRPLSGILNNLILIFTPLLGVLNLSNKIKVFKLILEDAKLLDLVIQRLSEQDMLGAK